MSDEPHLALTLINALGLLSLLVGGYTLVRRSHLTPTWRGVALGLLFAAGAIVAMFNPAFLQDGVRVDGRVMIVGMVAAFGGLVPATVAATIVGAYRLWIGGIGAPIGIVTLAWGTAVGLLWHYRVFRRDVANLGWLALLGLGFAAQPLFFLMLPIAMTAKLMFALVVGFAGTCVAGAMVMGSLILREERMIARETELSDFAYSDPLTGLANRRSFEHEARGLLSREHTASHVLLVIDVDHFKDINDRHGHVAGDLALRRLAELLRLDLRTGDRVARHGGEEFTLLLPRTGSTDGFARAEDLRRRIAETDIVLGAETVRLSVSIGMSDGIGLQSYQKLLRDADDALYQAKRAGRNCTVRAGDEHQVLPLFSAAGDRRGLGEVVGGAHLVQA